MTHTHTPGASPSALDPILQRTLRAIRRRREHGFHFAGNFLAVSFDRVTVEDSLVSMKADCHARDGAIDGTALGVLADLALAAPVRAALPADTRLATVNMQLQLTGAPCHAPVTASSSFHGYVHGAAGRQAISRVTLHGAGREIGLGTATFMVLDLPAGTPIPFLTPVDPAQDEAPLLDPDADLNPDERAVYEHVRMALRDSRAGDGFADRLWGYRARQREGGASGTLGNGPHIGNRVGHVQGGVLLGFAQTTAQAALGEGWAMSSITATYVSPGEGRELKAEADIVHQGRTTAVTRVAIATEAGKRVLEVLATHSLSGARP
ncbi:Thioesterase domain-containing protein [Bordetella sputigena]|uniref:PaaI family thioesterase n=1 Tax=Bordetella sputigena TaxID=1416810 RepID=UPI0039EE15C8